MKNFKFYLFAFSIFCVQAYSMKLFEVKKLEKHCHMNSLKAIYKIL